MKNDSILWRMSSRETVPDLLLGRETVSSLPASPWLDEYRLKAGDVAIGYLASREQQQYSPPCILLIEEDKAVETFSWLRVYAGEIWPLSQYARLISRRDWLEFDNPIRRSLQPREDVWASVVLGEVIAQGETDVDVEAIPLSRASACFSMAMARVVCSFGDDVATSECAERLRKIEVDRRFVRRPVTVEDLRPVWSLATAALAPDDEGSIESTAIMVVDAVQGFMPDAARALFEHVPISLGDMPGFSSNSVEDRVLAFHRLSAVFAQLKMREAKNPFVPVLLAGAAFLVGRGTTHEFLLRRVSRSYPAASVWFGLLAAIAGPTSWSPNWARAVKGIERQIRTRFEWSEVNGFDLGWHEYRWMASVFDGVEALSSLPKLLPRVLSVEVVPGAVCQFRLAGGGMPDVEVKSSPDQSREHELIATLSQFISLAGQAQQLIDGAQIPVQRGFGFDTLEHKSPAKKRSRSPGNKA